MDRFSLEFWGPFYVYMLFAIFCSLPDWNVLISGMFWKIYPPCTSTGKMTKVSLTIKGDDITNGTVIMDPNCQLLMVQEQMG